MDIKYLIEEFLFVFFDSIHYLIKAILNIFAKFPIHAWGSIFGVVFSLGYIKNIKYKQAERIIVLEEKRREFLTKKTGELYLKYTQKLQSPPFPMTEKDIKDVEKDIKILFTYSKLLTSDIANYIYCLTSTIMNIHQSEIKTINGSEILSYKFYQFLIKILYWIDRFSSNPVPTPSLFSRNYIKKKLFIHRKIKKYVSDPKMNQYNFISLGTTKTLCDQEFIHFYNSVMQTNERILMYSCLRGVYNSTIPIQRILYLAEIYFPPIISLNMDHPTEKCFRLLLFGFTKVTTISDDTEDKVKLFFTEEDFQWTSGDIETEICINFKDEYLNIDFLNEDERKTLKFMRYGSNLFVYELPFSFLNNKFNSIKRKFSKKMKKQLKS